MGFSAGPLTLKPGRSIFGPAVKSPLERAPPGDREFGNAEQALDAVGIVLVVMHHPVCLGYVHALRRSFEQHDVVTRTDLSGLEAAKIETRKPSLLRPQGQLFDAVAGSQLEAGLAGLAHLYGGAPDPINVSDPHVRLQRLFGTEVLAEGSRP